MNSKSYIALLLLALVSVKTLLVPVVYLDFEMRKDYIIQNLRENRFKTKLNCNGACYLAKKLHKIAEDNATKETQKQAASMKKILEEVFETTPLFSYELKFKNLSQKTSNYLPLLAHPQSFTFSLFHSPTV